MPAALKADWEAIERKARGGQTLESLSVELGIKLPTLKSRSRRFGWNLQLAATGVRAKYKGVDDLRGWIEESRKRMRKLESFFQAIEKSLERAAWMEAEAIYAEIKALLRNQNK